MKVPGRYRRGPAAWQAKAAAMAGLSGWAGRVLGGL
jgi:hypothetical protein